MIANSEQAAPPTPNPSPPLASLAGGGERKEMFACRNALAGRGSAATVQGSYAIALPLLRALFHDPARRSFPTPAARLRVRGAARERQRRGARGQPVAARAHPVDPGARISA